MILTIDKYMRKGNGGLNIIIVFVLLIEILDTSLRLRFCNAREVFHFLYETLANDIVIYI